MASSSDAVRNFVYDFHRHNLRRGWQIVQQLEQKGLDSWERIHHAYPVKDSAAASRDIPAEEGKINAFCLTCPLLGEELAAQLLMQASSFVSPQKQQKVHRSRSGRPVRHRIDRAHFWDRITPAFWTLGAAGGGAYHQDGKVPKNTKLVPFFDVVHRPGFPTTAE